MPTVQLLDKFLKSRRKPNPPSSIPSSSSAPPQSSASVFLSSTQPSTAAATATNNGAAASSSASAAAAPSPRRRGIFRTWRNNLANRTFHANIDSTSPSVYNDSSPTSIQDISHSEEPSSKQLSTISAPNANATSSTEPPASSPSTSACPPDYSFADPPGPESDFRVLSPDDHKRRNLQEDHPPGPGPGPGGDGTGAAIASIPMHVGAWTSAGWHLVPDTINGTGLPLRARKANQDSFGVIAPIVSSLNNNATDPSPTPAATASSSSPAKTSATSTTTTTTTTANSSNSNNIVNTCSSASATSAPVYLAVFDGHGVHGREASQLARDSVPDVFVAALQQALTSSTSSTLGLSTFARGLPFGRGFSRGGSSHKGTSSTATGGAVDAGAGPSGGVSGGSSGSGIRNGLFSQGSRGGDAVHDARRKAFVKAFVKAFSDAERALREDRHGIDHAFSGTTGTVVWVDGSELYCAWVGDSRAVMGRCRRNRFRNRNLSRNRRQRHDENNDRHPKDTTTTTTTTSTSTSTAAAAAAAEELDNHLALNSTANDHGLNYAGVGASQDDPFAMYDTVDLTWDQKPTRRDEKKRVRAAGGRVTRWRQTAGSAGPQRVWLPNEWLPGLAMTRSIGDTVLSRYGVVPHPEVTVTLLSNGYDGDDDDDDDNDDDDDDDDADPNLTADENVGDRVIDTTTDGDEENENMPEDFIVVASDGVWEFMSSAEVIALVARLRATGMQASDIAVKLVDEAVRRWNMYEQVVDDTTAIIAFLHHQNNGSDDDNMADGSVEGDRIGNGRSRNQSHPEQDVKKQTRFGHASIPGRRMMSASAAIFQSTGPSGANGEGRRSRMKQNKKKNNDMRGRSLSLKFRRGKGGKGREVKQEQEQERQGASTSTGGWAHATGRSRRNGRRATIACGGHSKNNRVVKRRTPWLVNASGKLEVFNVTAGIIGNEHNLNEVEDDDEEEDDMDDIVDDEEFHDDDDDDDEGYEVENEDGNNMAHPHMEHLQLQDVVQEVHSDEQVVVEHAYMHPHSDVRQGDKDDGGDGHGGSAVPAGRGQR